jgi:hemolysin activation/secretion protein
MLKNINLAPIVWMAICVRSIVESNAMAQAPPIQNLPQQNPNPVDRFPQSIPKLEPLPSSKPGKKPTPSSTPSVAPSLVRILVQKIEVVGATVLKPIEIQQITQTVEGKSITLTELQGVATAITQLYLDRGYITSRAIVGQQEIVNGVVKIQAIEGSIEQVEIQGLERLKSAYVRDRLQLGIGKPFNQNALEDQLRLLKSDPLLADLEATLKPGTGGGQSILTVRLKESNPFTGFVGIDNSSSPSTGAERFGGVASYRNVSGLGDEFSASYFRSFQGGSNAFDFNYRLPVNPMNGTVQLRYAPNRSKITDPQYAALGIRSDSDLYEFSYRQPLIRSSREEFALSLGLAFQDGQTFVNENQPQPFGIGADANGNSRTRVLKFGQDYITRDERGAWAFRSQLNFGLNIANTTTNSSPIPSGQFFSWLGQVQRAQRLNTNHLLIAQADLQLTPDSLLPSQQFTIGGGQNLRGYSQNARSGDNGFRLSVEDRIALQTDRSGVPILQLAPFVDLGTVWNRSDNPNNSSLPSQRFLSSIGLGAIYQPAPQFNLRLDYAIPLVNLSQTNDSAKNQSLSFSAGYSF